MSHFLVYRVLSPPPPPSLIPTWYLVPVCIVRVRFAEFARGVFFRKPADMLHEDPGRGFLSRILYLESIRTCPCGREYKDRLVLALLGKRSFYFHPEYVVPQKIRNNTVVTRRSPVTATAKRAAYSFLPNTLTRRGGRGLTS